MAHGKNKFKMPPMFKRDKDLLSIANDPKKFNALKAVIDQATKMNENFKHFKNIHEWYCYVASICTPTSRVSVTMPLRPRSMRSASG